MKKYYVDCVIQTRLIVEANSEQEAKEKAYNYNNYESLILIPEDDASMFGIQVESDFFEVNDIIEMNDVVEVM